MSQVISLEWRSEVVPARGRFVVDVGTEAEREEIYAIRHDVYARELGQHPMNGAQRLSDGLDEHNVYLVARCGGTLAGFVSLTPAGAPAYSVEKYFQGGQLPIVLNGKQFEIRLLTVRKPYRGTQLATLLMYAALRWVEAHGGTHLIAIGRREVVELYERAGLKRFGPTTRAGAVTYDLMHASVDDIRKEVPQFSNVLERLQGSTDWRLSFPFQKPAACFHGGAFFNAIGERFDDLKRHERIINADVLDAWFPPSPNVIRALQEYLPWLLRTSPPTDCRGLIEAIADARGVESENVLPGAGSSDLIFRAFRQWLTPDSHALILDPTYGEYSHVLERVIGCTVDRLSLNRRDDYDIDPGRLEAALADGYDLVVLVNPNSPTGRHVRPGTLEDLLRKAPARTRVWIDETYVEYAGEDQSLERFAAERENVIVCKSMSKVYALSGARVGYLCAGAHQLEALRAITPPWVIGLPAQVAAVKALEDPEYYRARHMETAELRREFSKALTELGWDVLPGIANFVLCHLPSDGPSARAIAAECRAHGLFVRDAAAMGSRLGTHTLRIAVKDKATNERIVEILQLVNLNHG